MSADQTFVIVGASLAGAKAAETLRTEGFDGRVVLVGAEPARPYEPLSKAYLRGEADFDVAAVHGEDYYAANDIELRTSTTVTGLDPRTAHALVRSVRPVDRARLADPDVDLASLAAPLPG